MCVKLRKEQIMFSDKVSQIPSASLPSSMYMHAHTHTILKWFSGLIKQAELIALENDILSQQGNESMLCTFLDVSKSSQSR